LATRNLSDDLMVLMVNESLRQSAAQRRDIPAIGKYTGGMRSLGMRSRIPAGRA
jgi:hypothetical protein